MSYLGANKYGTVSFFFFPSLDQNICSKNLYHIFFQRQRYLWGCECKNRKQRYEHRITEELPCPLALPQNKIFYNLATLDRCLPRVLRAAEMPQCSLPDPPRARVSFAACGRASGRPRSPSKVWAALLFCVLPSNSCWAPTFLLLKIVLPDQKFRRVLGITILSCRPGGWACRDIYCATRKGCPMGDSGSGVLKAKSAAAAAG